jgi:hypothetical protein
VTENPDCMPAGRFRSNKDLNLRRFDRKTASIWPKRTCHIGHTFSAKKESAEL